MGILNIASPHLRHQHHYDGGNHSNNLLNMMNFSSSTAIAMFFSPSLSSASISHDGLSDSEDQELEIFNHNLSDAVSNWSTPSPPQNLTLKCFTSPYYRSIYPLVLPVLLFFCILSIFVNALIVVSARWCRRSMSPTLYFSISLALADAFAALVLGTGLILNSLLPCVYDIFLENRCFPLTLEVFRLGGILITVYHLLALGINHWIGIIRPLHYASTMTRRTAWIVIIASWTLPVVFFFIYFSSHHGQGYLAYHCKHNRFLNRRTFRAIFASLFFVPLLIMTMIYTHIFFIVRNHHQHRPRYQGCQQLRRNIKAVVTTVLILGTYILGWMPGLLWYAIVCDDCAVTLHQVQPAVAVPVSIVNNSLIILKAFINPIIYAARMSDIQMALKKMQYELLRRCCGKCVPDQPPTDPLERGSTCETRSLRMSSRGSTNSSRRPGAINSVNASTNHPTTQPLSNHLTNHNNGNGSVAFEMNEWN